MALFVLGDTHLSLGGSKPMDIFPGVGWLPGAAGAQLAQTHHPAGYHRAGRGTSAGAMRLTDTRKDFCILQQLPGQKLIMKGQPRLLVDHSQQDERLPQGGGL